MTCLPCVFLLMVSSYTDISTFRCNHVAGCEAHNEEYSCSLRKEVQNCEHGQAALMEQISKAKCKTKCHFNKRCGSYVWSPLDTLCTQCMPDSQITNYTWFHTLNPVRNTKKIKQSQARKLGYGIHSGNLAVMSVEGIDYVKKGYIDPRPSGFEIKSALLPFNTKEIVWTFKTPFCILTPLHKEVSEQLYSSRSSWTRTPTPPNLTLFLIVVMLFGLLKYYKRPQRLNRLIRKLQGQMI